MGDVALPRIAGVFLLAAVATNLIAFVIGSSRGLAPPPAFDIGNAQHLSADASSHWLPLTLSLLSPVFAIPAGLGIYHVLKSAGWPALFGVVMFFVGMIFVVLLDVLARRHRARCARVRHRTRRRAAVDSGTGRHDRYRHRRARVRRTLLQFRPRPAGLWHRDHQGTRHIELAWRAGVHSRTDHRLARTADRVCGTIAGAGDWHRDHRVCHLVDRHGGGVVALEAGSRSTMTAT